MGELSQARMGAVRQLIEQVPDAAIRTLETALAHGARGDRSLTLVQDMVGAEVLERRARGAVFYPLLPLCQPPPDFLQRLTYPRAVLMLTWRGLKAAAPQDVADAVRAFTLMRHDDEAPDVFDLLCRRAARGVRDGDEAFRALALALKPQGEGAVKSFADSLDLVPLARRALARAPAWVRTLSTEHAAAIRLAFRDAAVVGEDAGPPFMEILFGHMESPHEILRLISLVMDRPSDRYLAASELASFGERLLGDLDRRIDEVRRFDPGCGLEGGTAQAASVQTATAIAHEFEQWLALNREGPWGQRLVAQKRALALAVESRLREVEGAVGAALPSLGGRPGAKKSRGLPRLAADPDPAAVLRLLTAAISGGRSRLGSARQAATRALYGWSGSPGEPSST